MRHIFVLIISLLFCGVAFGQNILTNESVMEMVKSGLGETIIIAKVNNSESKFDTSTAALGELVKANVPEKIVAAMIDKTGAEDKKLKEQAAKDSIVEITLEAPENGELAEISEKTKVYFYTSDARAREVMKKELTKYAHLESVDSMEKSEFILVYEIVGVRTIGTLIGPFDQVTGDLYAVTLGQKNSQGKTRVRILYSVRKTRQAPADENAAKSALQKFIKDFKKVRGEK